jgi:DNA/RNA endonuclease YhcR with UshA esterase domain
MALFRRKNAETAPQEAVHGIPMAEVPLRTPVIVCGKVTRMRTRPAHGVPALVVTLRDDTGFVTAIWTGRRTIGGIALGRTISLEGVCTKASDGATFMNPEYTLIK